MIKIKRWGVDGFIYILSNSAFNTLKIGRTSKAPEERRRELSSETGVPAPYKIEYYAFVENYESVERQVHLKLDSNRPQKNKEHFNCTVPEAIIVIEDIANVKYKEVFYKYPKIIKKEKKEFGIDRQKRILEEYSKDLTDEDKEKFFKYILVGPNSYQDLSAITVPGGTGNSNLSPIDTVAARIYGLGERDRSIKRPNDEDFIDFVKKVKKEKLYLL